MRLLAIRSDWQPGRSRVNLIRLTGILSIFLRRHVAAIAILTVNGL